MGIGYGDGDWSPFALFFKFVSPTPTDLLFCFVLFFFHPIVLFLHNLQPIFDPFLLNDPLFRQHLANICNFFHNFLPEKLAKIFVILRPTLWHTFRVLSLNDPLFWEKISYQKTPLSFELLTEQLWHFQGFEAPKFICHRYVV